MAASAAGAHRPAAGARRRAARAPTGLAGADRRPPRHRRCASTCASRAAAGAPLSAPELVIRDPLRMCERRVAGPGGEEVLVLPAVEPVIAQGGGGRAGVGPLTGHGGRAAAGRLPGAEAELDLDGLRPYRPGASASRIHWPALARTGEMLERRLVAESESSPLVVLDARRPATEESLDAAVRAAASLCVHLARLGGVGRAPARRPARHPGGLGPGRVARRSRAAGGGGAGRGRARAGDLPCAAAPSSG